LFIAGLVCLTIAPHLGWLPSTDVASSILDVVRGQGLSDEIRREWGSFLSVAIFTFIFAASAGYFTCCWPGKRPARRVLLLVVMPAFVGFCAICVKYISLLTTPQSVLQRGPALGYGPARILTKLWMLGTGIRFSFAGLVLVIVFALLLLRGKASLPLAVLQRQAETAEDTDAWKGCKRLIWIFQGAPLLTSIPLNLISLLLLLIPVGPAVPWQYEASRAMTPAAEGFAFGAIAAGAMGKDNWKYIRQKIQLPTLRYAGLGLAIPTVPALLTSLLIYVRDRAYWAAHSFGKLEPPRTEHYFSAPQAWMVALFLGAFAEEVIFRGVLQRHFIERFGLWRGICFVATVWGAFHFFGDSYHGLNDLWVVLALFSRVLICLILGFVLAWLTLRSKSLIPATLAHGVNNVLAYSKPEVRFPGQHWVYLGLLAIVAYALFRYWPVETSQGEFPSATGVAIEPAVLT
jgi:membrane protease YdiL (CAAX protease family)